MRTLTPARASIAGIGLGLAIALGSLSSASAATSTTSPEYSTQARCISEMNQYRSQGYAIWKTCTKTVFQTWYFGYRY